MLLIFILIIITFTLFIFLVTSLFVTMIIDNYFNNSNINCDRSTQTDSDSEFSYRDLPDLIDLNNNLPDLIENEEETETEETDDEDDGTGFLTNEKFPNGY